MHRVLPGAMLICALFMSACNRDRAEETTREREAVQPLILGPEDVARVTTGSVITGPVISGELEAKEKATVRAQLSGAVTEVQASEGERVKQGEVLARIRAVAEREAVGAGRAAVRTAESDLEVARRDAERTEVLVKAGALAQRDLEQARAAVDAAEARVAEAQARLTTASEQLSEAVVRSPLTGIVSNAAVDSGDVVSVGAELFTIIDPKTLELRASVPARNLRELKTGTPVEFTVQGYPGRTFRGVIRRISPAADAATGQVAVFASIPNDSGLLISGLYAQGRLATGADNTLVIPSEAVRSRGDSSYVLKVENNQVISQPVTLGARDERSGRIEVISGLAQGDTVLVGPAADLQPGAPVRLRQSAAQVR